MKLSIVVLTWNSGKFIRQCLNSVKEAVRNIDFEIIVVDNGSKDESLDILQIEYPEVVLIKNGFNRGVAPARNQGISLAKGDYIMILDIDTYIYPDTIKSMLCFMEENKVVGLCAPKLVFPDKTIQKSCRKFPLTYMKLLRRVDTDWAKKILENENYTNEMSGNMPFEVDYAIGACQMFRKSASDKVGLLDEKIFYGPEDVDYCLRMWLAGFKVCYLPYAEVIHYEQRITKGNLFSKVMLMHIKGLIYYFCKYKYGFSRKKLYKLIGK